MKTLTLLLLLPITALGAPDASEAGRVLFEKDCAGCHTSLGNGDPAALFTRPDRRVQSLAGLGKQVRACRDNLGLPLFDDEIDALVRYLDGSYYHFGR